MSGEYEPQHVPVLRRPRLCGPNNGGRSFLILSFMNATRILLICLNCRGEFVSCPICEKRKPARFCPAKDEKICAVCCGTCREVTLVCPSVCSYLLSAHCFEYEHHGSLPELTSLPAQNIPEDN